MMRGMVAALAVVSALGLSGCNTPQDANAARGAVVGGTTGALIGGLASGRPGGALVGGAIGAASGAILGAAATPPPPYYAGPDGPPPRCLRRGYDAYGEPVCLRIARY